MNKDKPRVHANKVLMLDARGVYRKVTRKIFDFSPEHLANLTAIIWLYRGQSDRFVALIAEHLAHALKASVAAHEPLAYFMDALEDACEIIAPAFKGKDSEVFAEFDALVTRLQSEAEAFGKSSAMEAKAWGKAQRDNDSLQISAGRIGTHGEQGHALAKDIDHASKLLARLVDAAESENGKSTRDVKQASKLLEDTRAPATVALNQIRYFARHACWLEERFPDAKLRDVEGLVKLVDFKMLEAKDWSLTPGRYVGVAPQEEDENFDFEETMREIHGELADLNAEAVELTARIAKTLEALII